MQKEIDKEKLELIDKLVPAMSLSKPIILLMRDNDWCWAQYYIIKFLERDALVLILEEDRDKIKIESTDNITVKYHNRDNDDYFKIMDDYMNNYVLEVVKHEKIKEKSN